MKTLLPSLGNRSAVECLEARIAPASLLTFTDVDGDIVKIKSSKGDLTGHATFIAQGSGQQLAQLDLTDASFTGTNLTFQVKKSSTGDGQANVGFINAAGIDLGKVVVKGDLGRIVAGDGNPAVKAIKSLTARSMGLFGTTTQGGTAPTAPTTGQLTAVTTLVGDLTSGTGGLLTTLLHDASALLTTGGLSDSAQRLVSALVTDASGLLDTDPLSLASLTGGLPPLLAKLSADVQSLLGFSGSDLSALGDLVTVAGSVDTQVNAALGLGQGGQTLQHDLLNLPPITVTIPPITVPIIDVPIPPIVITTPPVVITLPTLPVITIPDIDLSTIIPTIPLGDLGGALGGVLGDLPTTVTDTLTALGTTLTSLTTLGTSDLAQLPPDLQSLLGTTVPAVTQILAGTAPLTADIVHQLATLQTAVTSLLGIASHSTDLLSSTVTPLLQTLTKTVTTLIGGGDGSVGSVSTALSSDIRGNVGTLKIANDVSDIFLNIQGSIGTVNIRGSLMGNSQINGGELHATGNVGTITIGKNLVGGAALNTGLIDLGGTLTSLKIAHSIIGGLGVHSASVSLHGSAKSIQVNGDLSGSTGLFSGSVGTDHGRLTTMLVKGSVISGQYGGASTIYAADDLKTLTINGSLLGDSDDQVVISAEGENPPTATHDLAFNTIKINGSMNHASLLAGFNLAGKGLNHDAQIKTITIGRDYLASNISAGIGSGADAWYGNADDQAINQSALSNPLISTISKLVIRGTAVGSAAPGEHFGIVAENIVKVLIGGVKFPMHNGAHNDIAELSPATGDLTVREVPAPTA